MRAESRKQKAEMAVIISAFCFLLSALSAVARVIDDFKALDWSPRPSDGVSLSIVSDPAGHAGAAMRLDFDFHGHGGYAIAHKNVSIDLPSDYQFSFWIRGNARPNNLEFKLIDATGDNVWWINQRNFEFPRDWTRLVLKKRHFQFAWGPLGGGEPRHIAAIEIVVTAGSGGRGSVWIDDLDLQEHHVTAVEQALVFTSPAIAFPEMREFGGLIVDSDASDYDVQTSLDGQSWQTLYAVRGARSKRQYLYTPESEARQIRTVPAARKVVVEPVAWSASPNAFFTNIAAESPRGDFPRAFHNEQSYWTVVGIDGDTNEALFNTDGAAEPFKGGFSIEPFLYTDGRLITWADVQSKPSLARGYLPIPTVRWPQLAITASAIGTRGRSALRVRYTLKTKKPATLFLALRPFQVNPPWQFLGVTGGVSRIGELRCGHDGIRVDAHHVIAKADCRAAAFDEGNVIDSLRNGKLPPARTLSDPHGWATGILAFHLRPNETAMITVPLHADWNSIEPDWPAKLDRVVIRIPERRIVDSIRANLAHILIHRDGPALQPGSRAYERSWIRDGSMMSEALLRLGLPEVVREYIDWYVKFQDPDGKVPCCVDERGADPVPENDSHGELIYLIAEYFRYTHDRALVERVWPHVVSAVGYIDTLRRTQTAPEFFGLLPESISHEGYSAKPQHSLWDDFFAAKGLADAVYLATALGHAGEARRFSAIHDEFERDLLAAVGRAMEAHHIDSIPGSVELGDYDPTSTTIAISPGGQLGRLPSSAVAATFDRYFAESHARASGARPWESYTPYELRTVGTFIRLGQPARAHELLDFFFRGQRPPEWHEWAEVVWRDPRTPKFIGDMPHGWVGSDYLRSVLDMFAYDRDDGMLVIGAGLDPEWIRQAPGVVVRGLRTHEGTLNYTMLGDRVSISGNLDARRGIVIRSPRNGKEVVVHRVPIEVRLPK